MNFVNFLSGFVHPNSGELSFDSRKIWMASVAAFILYLFGQFSKNRKSGNVGELPEGIVAPLVTWNLPFLGHGLSFSRDIIGFITKCYQTYGQVFQIQIFRVKMLVVCDPALKLEFFKSPENQMSLYDVLSRLYFGDAFSDDPNSLPVIINIVKRSIALKYDTFVPKIESEARRLIQRLRSECETNPEKNFNLSQEMMRFVACTSSHCFTNVRLSDEIFKVLLDFTNRLNRIVVLTYFLPKWVLRLLFNSRISSLRKRIVAFFEPEIQKYRDDPHKSDSLVLRNAVDYVDEKTGKGLSNEAVGEIIVCLLNVSSENTALGLTYTLTDLALHPNYWDRSRAATTPFLKNGDLRGLFALELLNACVMESARLNSHIFALNRRPLKAKSRIGSYVIPNDVDCVALCEPMIMVYGDSAGTFKNPRAYNPTRFLGEAPESFSPVNVLTWGAGVHLCPGKMFALYEIKIAIALVLQNFKFEIDKGSISELNYFSPSAFAERRVVARLKVLDEEKINTAPAIHQIGDYKVETLPEGGWLVRNYLSPIEQKEYYKTTFEISGSDSRDPTLWADSAGKLWQLLQEKHDKVGFNGPTRPQFDSLHAQLFPVDGSTKKQKDEDVNWGISVNIGASATYSFGANEILLHSGHIFVADFSKVAHGVERVHENSVPDWFNEEEVETFGRIGCTIQIRDVSKSQPAESQSTGE